MNNPLSNVSASTLLELLGLQSKPSNSSRALMYGGILAAGVVVGAAGALLLAPKSGRLLRGDLQKGAKEIGEHVSTSAGQALEAAQRKVSDIRNHTADVIEKAKA